MRDGIASYKLTQKQEIGLYTPHPNPAKHSYEFPTRGEGTSQTGLRHKFPPPLMGGDEGEGEGDAYARPYGRTFIRIMSIYLVRLL